MGEITSLRYNINPFICSTDDFLDERTFLSKNIFPTLKQHCSIRGGSFLPQEWDCCIDKDRLERGFALNLAFECITQSSPFFICLIGEKYGKHRPEGSSPLPSKLSDLNTDASWIDRNIVQAAESGYPWVLDETYSSTSLFEMKVIQAAFLSEDSHFCHFYIHEPDNTAGIKSNPCYGKFKLQQLKTNIAKRGLHVTYYRTFEELGNAVLAEWDRIILTSLPVIPHSTIGFDLLCDRVQHQSYGERSCGSFVSYTGVEDCLRTLTEFSSSVNDYTYDLSLRAGQFEKATGVRLLRRERLKSEHNPLADRSDQASICVLTGPRGCGKTALVSYWINNKTMSTFPAGAAVIYHYVPCDRMARDITVFMKRCITELRRHYCRNFDERISLDGEYPDFIQLKETFLASLGLGTCVIILDGLDELSDSCGCSMTEIKSLNWLSDLLPPTCKFVFTVTDSDLTRKLLSQRKDVMFITCPVLTSYEDKRQLFSEFTSKSNVKLSRRQMSYILNYKLSSSPIYLYMMASEFRDSRVQRVIIQNDGVVYCTIAFKQVYANSDSISNSTRDMCLNLMRRWVRDFSWTRYKEDNISQVTDRLDDAAMQGWVPDVLRLMVCSRNGLHVEEILGTLRYGLGYMGHRAVTAYDWMLFYNAAKPMFYQKPNGLLTIYHEHLVEVLDFLLLGHISPPAAHDYSGGHLIETQRGSGLQRRQIHISLASHLLSQPSDVQLQRILEILWQLEMANDLMRLCNILLLPQVVHKLNGPLHTYYSPTQVELLRLFHLLKDNKVDLLSKMDQVMERIGMVTTQRNSGELDEADVSNLDGPSIHRKTTANTDFSYGKYYVCDSWERSFVPAASQKSNSESAYMAHEKSSTAEDDYVRLVIPEVKRKVSNSTDHDQMTKTTNLSNYSEVRVDKTEAPMSSVCATGTMTAEHIDRSPSHHNQALESTESRREITRAPPALLLHNSTDDSASLLLSQPITETHKSTMVYICAKILITIGYPQEDIEIILSHAQSWITMQYPLTSDELFVLSQIYSLQCQTYTEKCELKKAIECLEKAHEAIVDMSSDTVEDNPNDHMLTFFRAKCKVNMAQLHAMCDSVDLAEVFIKESRAGMLQIHSQPGCMYIQYIVALLRYNQRWYDQATNYLMQCLEYFEHWLGPMHPLVADICHHLGTVLADQDNTASSDPDQAAEMLWKALNIRSERDPASLSTADTLFQLAFLVQKKGSKIRKRDAIDFLQICFDIRTKKLGVNHEETKKVVYLLNDLEISLRLGQYEFGQARPTDMRTADLPYSELTMHEKALTELRMKQGVKRSNRASARSGRPKSAFQVEKARSTSRLEQALHSRPNTAPTRLSVHCPLLISGTGATQKSALVMQANSLAATEHGDHGELTKWINANGDADCPSPRTYNSGELEEGDEAISVVNNHDIYRPASTVLDKYNSKNQRHSSMALSQRGDNPNLSSVSTHRRRCSIRGPHDIRSQLRTSTLGPNSTITSIAGRMPPLVNRQPVHKSAWYHLPNNYKPDRPQLNLHMFALKKPHKLTAQRSKSAALNSRFLTHNIKTIDSIHTAGDVTAGLQVTLAADSILDG